MARRKPIAEAELLPPEDDDGAKIETKPVRKVVETKTVTYEAPPEEPLKENDDEDFDYEIEPRKKKKATEKEERDKLRAELTKYGVTPASDLRYSLFKYVDPNSPIAGNQAETESCGRFQITKEGLLNGDHVEKARTFGPGRYFFMVYKSNQLVSSFDARIAQGWQPQAQPGMVNTIDPVNPGVTIQMPAGQTQPYIDPLKQMRESFKMMKEMREAMGMIDPLQNPQPPQLSPELQMAGFMLQDADLKKKAIKSLFGSNGDSGEKDVLTVIIENAEPIGKALEGIIRQIFSNVQDLRGSNGRAQMVTQAFQTEGQAGQSAQQILSQAPESKQQAGQPQGILETDQSAAEIAPEDTLLAFVLDQCNRKIPPKIVARRILDQADTINRVAPIQSIDGFLELFISLTPDEVLAFVASYSETGKEIAGLGHAKAWTESLQAELKPAFQEGGQT
ncbi:MAG: hypothetical protein KGJ13_05710 [Patescibacteria group bacterium]|nr:hypothetical protein [Patescibacteria group bacterium]